MAENANETMATINKRAPTSRSAPEFRTIPGEGDGAFEVCSERSWWPGYAISRIGVSGGLGWFVASERGVVVGSGGLVVSLYEVVGLGGAFS